MLRNSASFLWPDEKVMWSLIFLNHVFGGHSKFVLEPFDYFTVVLRLRGAKYMVGLFCVCVHFEQL
jgi:hypothetical protein